MPVEPGKTAELSVESIHPLENRFELSNLDSGTVNVLIEQKRITPAIQQDFSRVLEEKQKIEGISTQIANRKRESDQIASDQSRIRENMKALKGSSEEKVLIQRYVAQLDSQESRLATLRKESSDLNAQQNTAAKELDQTIMGINVDETF
jgi:septal ring factor EnvC (AmiA/AmiB activator)